MRSERCSHKQTSQTHRGVSEESENKFSGFFFFFWSQIYKQNIVWHRASSKSLVYATRFDLEKTRALNLWRKEKSSEQQNSLSQQHNRPKPRGFLCAKHCGQY